MKVLVLTDSVALPRLKPEYVSMEETWPALLRSSGHEIIQCSIGAATLSEIVKQSNYYNLQCLNVDLVLIQCGIVDCAPRFVKKWEHNFLRRIPYFGKRIIKLLNKGWVRQVRNITYTSRSQFKAYINLLKGTYNDKLYFISVIPANEEYERALRGASKNICQYNDILKLESNVIEIGGVEQGGVMSDGHHLNSKGHLFVYNRVVSHIENVVS